MIELSVVVIKNGNLAAELLDPQVREKAREIVAPVDRFFDDYSALRQRFHGPFLFLC